MEVERYIYQSPYRSPVQFGRPDPSVQKESDEMELSLNSNETLKKAKRVENQLTQQSTQEEHPLNQTNRLLDTYA